MQAAMAVMTQAPGESRPAGAVVRSLEQLRTVLGAGEHLGDMVWWTLADASLDRATLEARWAGAGLPAELLPEPPTAEKALRLAVKACQVGQAEHLVRLAKDGDGELIYAVGSRQERRQVGCEGSSLAAAV
jgi:hypothetical protein